jgi:hypothetical protein
MSQPYVVTTTMWEYYLEVWKGLFREFLGWSEEETLRWAERWKTADGENPVDDPDDIFYHESPVYWANHELLPDPLKERLRGLELVDLERRILEAFWDEHRDHFPPGTDWRPYRAKVVRILAEYGASLPPVPAR